VSRSWIKPIIVGKEIECDAAKLSGGKVLLRVKGVWIELNASIEGTARQRARRFLSYGPVYYKPDDKTKYVLHTEDTLWPAFVEAKEL
jgi:hypothetical protein